jgi:hypothetical protein
MEGFSKTMSDEALEEMTADYRLVRIRRQAARTGRGGPGEFQWIWQVLSWILLIALIFPRKPRK